MGAVRRPPALKRAGPTAVLTKDSGNGSAVRRTVLPGGLRVVTETMPGMRSASFGVWVGVGSRDETPTLAGASHFLEHLLFKGTRTRTGMQISAAMDEVGGELNAFTAKEHTCYYAHVLAEDLPLAADVVCDVVTNAVIAAEDVDAERGVILEEIAMRDDDPSDIVHDVFGEALFGDTALGRPVVGTVESIESMRRDQVAGYYRRRYRPEAMVVSVAGALDHRQVVRLVRKAFGDRLAADTAPQPARAGGRPPRHPAQPVATIRRTTEQANLVLGTFGLSRHDERRFTLGVLNSALGGGMSSRLFQEVRERRGLAYSVYSFTSQYAGTGAVGVSAGCHPGKVHELLDVVGDQLAEVAANGLTEAEVARGKGQVRGGLVLGLEDTGSRMSRIGKGELSHGEVMDIEEMLARVDAVTVDEVRELAAEVLAGPRCLSVVGPFDEDDFTVS